LATVVVAMELDTLAAVAAAAVPVADFMAAPLLAAEPSTVPEQRLVAVAPAAVAQQHSHLARHYTVAHRQQRPASSLDRLPSPQCKQSKHTKNQRKLRPETKKRSHQKV
jgi:hypothetical protein